jgi:hypothetical protein
MTELIWQAKYAENGETVKTDLDGKAANYFVFQKMEAR